MATKIVGVDSQVEMDVHPTAKAGRSILYGPDGNPIDSDSQIHPVAAGGSGGFYTVAGSLVAVIAATLAASTPLMTMRLSASSLRKAQLIRMRILIAAATVGTSALIPGALALQRFNAATPSGGTARTVNKLDEVNDSTSDMTDVRDSNAALTVTNVVFGNIVAATTIPLFITSGAMWLEWIIEPIRPCYLYAGDGLSLRTSVVMPATQTWVFTYTAHWKETTL